MSEAIVRCRCGGRLDWRPDGNGAVVEFCLGNEHTGAPACGYAQRLGGFQPFAGQLVALAVPTPTPPVRIIALPGLKRCHCGKQLRRVGLQYPHEECWECRQHHPPRAPVFRRRCDRCGRPLRVRGGHSYGTCYRCRTAAHPQAA